MDDMIVTFVVLKSGEKLMGQFIENNSDDIVLKNIIEILIFEDMRNEEGQTGFTFREWVPSAFVETSDVNIKKSDTYCIKNPSAAMKKFYYDFADAYKEKIQIGSSLVSGNTSMEAVYDQILRGLPKQTVH